MELAKAWNLLPSEWDSLREEDKAEIAAFELDLGYMRAYEEHQEREKRLREEAARSVKGA